MVFPIQHRLGVGEVIGDSEDHPLSKSIGNKIGENTVSLRKSFYRIEEHGRTALSKGRHLGNRADLKIAARAFDRLDLVYFLQRGDVFSQIFKNHFQPRLRPNRRVFCSLISVHDEKVAAAIVAAISLPLTRLALVPYAIVWK